MGNPLAARELNDASGRAAGHGLRLGYHYHDFELSSLIGGRPALEVLADLLDPAVLLEVDTYWAEVAGQDVPALVGRLGDRVRFLHVKDGPVTPRDTATGRSSRRPERRPGAAWACWTWPAAWAPASRTGLPVSWLSTCSS